MRLINKFLTAGIFSLSLLLSGCEINVPTFNSSQSNSSHPSQSKPKIGNVSEKKIGQNYENPSGLSSIKNFNIEKSVKRDITKIDSKSFQGFPEMNIFTINPTFYESAYSFRTPPSIYGIDNSNSITNLYNFPDSEKDEFNIEGLQYNDTNGGVFIKPRGLSLETLILPDNSILAIPNISKKVYRIYQDNSGAFQEEIYLENDELFGTTGMIMGADSNTIYLAQIPFYNAPTWTNSLSTVRPKRIISFSLNDKTINIQPFSFPDIKINTGDGLWLVPTNNTTYNGSSFLFGDKLGIVEDSSGNFYVADSLDKRIYEATTSGSVSVFKELDRPPTSIAIDSEGDLFVVEGTLLNLDKTKASSAQLIFIDPSENESKIYSFNDNFDYTSETVFEYPVVINGVTNIFPKQDFSSSTVSETETNWSVYYTDYLGGAIQVVNVTKE